MPTPRRALIVDDERNIRLTLRTAIEDRTLQVDEAADAATALDLCAQVRFDVVLLDLRLPDRDGLDVLRTLRDRRSETPVVVITAHGTVDSAVEAMKLGAADFLQKPFDPNRIRDVVARALAGPTRDTYEALIADARRAARERSFEAAQSAAARALSRDPSRPDAYHLLGVVCDLRGERLAGQAYYRAALALDPTHRASESNLERSSVFVPGAPLLLGDEEPPRAR